MFIHVFVAKVDGLHGHILVPYNSLHEDLRDELEIRQRENQDDFQQRCPCKMKPWHGECSACLCTSKKHRFNPFDASRVEYWMQSLPNFHELFLQSLLLPAGGDPSRPLYGLGHSGKKVAVLTVMDTRPSKVKLLNSADQLFFKNAIPVGQSDHSINFPDFLWGSYDHRVSMQFQAEADFIKQQARSTN